MQSKPIFSNDEGYKALAVGTKAFSCKGVSEPFDHPHVFLDMGIRELIICPYCSTAYHYKRALAGDACEGIGDHAKR